jgi:hypothetical protein
LHRIAYFKEKDVARMDENNDQQKNRPDLTNYDYVWGSDQDQYLESDSRDDDSEEQEDDQVQ